MMECNPADSILAQDAPEISRNMSQDMLLDRLVKAWMRDICKIWGSVISAKNGILVLVWSVYILYLQLMHSIEYALGNQLAYASTIMSHNRSDFRKLEEKHILLPTHSLWLSKMVCNNQIKPRTIYTHIAAMKFQSDNAKMRTYTPYTCASHQTYHITKTV